MTPNVGDRVKKRRPHPKLVPPPKGSTDIQYLDDNNKWRAWDGKHPKSARGWVYRSGTHRAPIASVPPDRARPCPICDSYFCEQGRATMDRCCDLYSCANGREHAISRAKESR